MIHLSYHDVPHWCIFPTEEWEDGYKVQFYQGPGFAFGDFAADVSLIIDSGKQSIRARMEMKKNGSLDGSRSTADGLTWNESERESPWFGSVDESNHLGVAESEGSMQPLV